MNKDDLHPEKRNIVIGFKVNKTEKAELEKYCDDKGTNVSRFLRYAYKKVKSEKKK